MSSEPATRNLQPETAEVAPAKIGRRPRSKIAALPKDQRDIINQLFLDGSTYAAVIDRMSQLGISLNHQNVSNWFQTGFQDYLSHLERLDYQHAKYEAATDLLQNMDLSKIPEAGLQTAAAQIYDLLDRFTPAELAASLGTEPDKYIRMVNSLSRLTREALSIQKYSDSRARAALRQLDTSRQLDENETRTIVRRVDELFGLAHQDEALQNLEKGSRLGAFDAIQAPDPPDDSVTRAETASAPPAPGSGHTGLDKLPKPAGSCAS